MLTETVIVALISAIGGSLIKPLLDWLTQRETSKDTRDVAAYERAMTEINRKDLDLHDAKEDLAGALATLDVWREKYYKLFVKINQANELDGETKATVDVLTEILRED